MNLFLLYIYNFTEMGLVTCHILLVFLPFLLYFTNVIQVIDYFSSSLPHSLFQLSAFFSGNVDFMCKAASSSRPCHPAVAMYHNRAVNYMASINRVSYHQEIDRAMMG